MTVAPQNFDDIQSFDSVGDESRFDVGITTNISGTIANSQRLGMTNTNTYDMS